MTSTTSNSFSTDTLFYPVSTHQTGATTSTVPSISVQPTSGPGLGTFTGLKTFKPSSPFEASSLESLPPYPWVRADNPSYDKREPRTNRIPIGVNGFVSWSYDHLGYYPLEGLEVWERPGQISVWETETNPTDSVLLLEDLG